jgi:L-lysine epsilon oxidase C-terminal domain
MTWPMRNSNMYMAPFRIRHAAPGWIEPNFGEQLISDTLNLPDGPLSGQLPGGLTRWMAVPWQTDSASCRSGYQASYDPYVPTFWPARVPNQVVTKENYKIVMDQAKPVAERLAAFANRAAWIRPLGSKGYTDQINNMIHHFGDLGVVEQQPGPGDPDFPPTLEVEELPPHTHERLLSLETTHEGVERAESLHEADRIDLTGIEKVKRFPYGLRR